MIELKVMGFESHETTMELKELKVLVTADDLGKTISIENDETMFTIALEPVLEAIKQEETKE